jgi:hypothetical protein
MICVYLIFRQSVFDTFTGEVISWSMKNRGVEVLIHIVGCILITSGNHRHFIGNGIGEYIDPVGKY